MRQNRIYITGILLLFAFLSGRAQQPRIDELECRNLKIGYEKTLHMIFPTPVKYLNMGDENIIGEVIQVCPSVIRLKSTVRDFKGRDQPVGCYGGQQVLHLLHILRRGSAGCLQGGRYHAGNGGSSGF